ncbi:hypothetical protein NDU88_006112 [Pleurodeles waltl]|uniref:Uncharacterized protein n=1 Tax=Pleurodeles waltl TaxID=8319 RepID=A0AAV7TWU8_PLEWA|nr:hypothetical protein NDU88_006112 [Pleurodeles waltl]
MDGSERWLSCAASQAVPRVPAFLPCQWLVRFKNDFRDAPAGRASYTLFVKKGVPWSTPETTASDLSELCPSVCYCALACNALLVGLNSGPFIIRLFLTLFLTNEPCALFRLLYPSSVPAGCHQAAERVLAGAPALSLAPVGARPFINAWLGLHLHWARAGMACLPFTADS